MRTAPTRQALAPFPLRPVSDVLLVMNATATLLGRFLTVTTTAILLVIAKPAFMSHLPRPLVIPAKESASPVSVVHPADGVMADLPHPPNPDWRNPRTCIFAIGASAGNLCAVANAHSQEETLGSALVHPLAELLRHVHQTASSLNLDLTVAIQAKLELNSKKYPVDLCQGKAGKYTQYSNVTGVTASNQSTQQHVLGHHAAPLADLVHRLPDMAQEVAAFAEARHWTQFHTPRNLILALLGEVGELAELVQWKGDDIDDDGPTERRQSQAAVDGSFFSSAPRVPPLALTDAELDKLAQELADVSIYSLRIASVCQIVDPLCEALQEPRRVDKIAEDDAALQRVLAQDPSF
jgi:NTP pyrophosphatase (non-canonical NTP hydrolase)